MNHILCLMFFLTSKEENPSNKVCKNQKIRELRSNSFMPAFFNIFVSIFVKYIRKICFLEILEHSYNPCKNGLKRVNCHKPAEKADIKTWA